MFFGSQGGRSRTVRGLPSGGGQRRWEAARRARGAGERTMAAWVGLRCRAGHAAASLPRGDPSRELKPQSRLQADAFVSAVSPSPMPAKPPEVDGRTRYFERQRHQFGDAGARAADRCTAVKMEPGNPDGHCVKRRSARLVAANIRVHNMAISEAEHQMSSGWRADRVLESGKGCLLPGVSRKKQRTSSSARRKSVVGQSGECRGVVLLFIIGAETRKENSSPQDWNAGRTRYRVRRIGDGAIFGASLGASVMKPVTTAPFSACLGADG